MSAKPVLMYKLEGVPDEYDAYLNYLTGETSEQIAIELAENFANDYSTLLQKAADGRNFVLEQKCPKVQAIKIVSLLAD